ncbi:MAG: MarR family winged helix-turn-helix transcriptional regulator [Chloroflexota bacterium]|nr:MarR family winged helix-turn-helix transcriptional regulator [Chloroflexota bacterium]
MDQNIKPTTLRLMRALREFHKFGWQEHSIAGCKPSEIRVLFCIKHGMQPGASAMKVSEISKRLRVTSPTVTQLLKGLETNGFIERHLDPLDRRVVYIALSEKGETFTRQALESFTRSVDGLVEYLGEKESEQLADLLAKAFRYFGEQEARYFNESEATLSHFQ